MRRTLRVVIAALLAVGWLLAYSSSHFNPIYLVLASIVLTSYALIQTSKNKKKLAEADRQPSS